MCANRAIQFYGEMRRFGNFGGGIWRGLPRRVRLLLTGSVDARRHLAQAQTAEAAWQRSQAEERVAHHATWLEWKILEYGRRDKSTLTV
jgi:hypothetical protein